MRHLILILVFLFSITTVHAESQTDSLLLVLKNAIANTQNFDKAKINTIELLKEEQRKANQMDQLTSFKIYDRLFQEYKVYNYDSAFLICMKMQDLANALKSPSLQASVHLNLGFILLSSGMFKESIDALNSINIHAIDDSLKATYYNVLARYYYDLSDYNLSSSFSKGYISKAGNYVDSSLKWYPANSFERQYFIGLKHLKSGNWDSAFISFSHLLEDKQHLTVHNYALVTSTLSGFYIQKKANSEAINLLLEAAIADIRSSTKETTALLYVSGLLFNQGDTKNALICIEKANTDAQFYGARQRKIQIGSVLPMIEGQVISTIESQKKNLVMYSIVLTLFFLILIFLLFVIYQQLKRLRVSRDIISQAHLKEKEINLLLHEANTIKEQFNLQLKASNHLLLESNKIKEEYIGYFFQVDYKLLEKFEKFKTTIEKKLIDRKYDEIRFLIQNINLKQEKDDLLLSFDKIFIKLFPNFVKEFNSLFAEENRIVLKEEGLLNTELRIFALIRIGITDNEKIAQILDYSVNTIYTYKTKIRNRSLVSNDEFDQKLFKSTNLEA